MAILQVPRPSPAPAGGPNLGTRWGYASVTTRWLVWLPTLVSEPACIASGPSTGSNRHRAFLATPPEDVTLPWVLRIIRGCLLLVHLSDIVFLECGGCGDGLKPFEEQLSRGVRSYFHCSAQFLGSCIFTVSLQAGDVFGRQSQVAFICCCFHIGTRQLFIFI